jgi:hypothetical protein
MGLIAQNNDDKVSAAIAKYGLADKDSSVQLEALKVLGTMGRKNVTPQVIAFFQTCDKNIEMYIAAAEALGKLNDPRAVDPLSKAFWSRDFDSLSDEARNAKAEALGNIRHVSSVEALMDLLIATGGRKGGGGNARGQTVGRVVASLQKLTGQKIGRERDAWRDWWKDNKATFKFE